MNLLLNESSESIQLLIHKDSHCLSPNENTIHPKCDISHFQYYLEQIGWIVLIGTQGLALFPNESAVQIINELMIQWSNQ